MWRTIGKWTFIWIAVAAVLIVVFLTSCGDKNAKDENGTNGNKDGFKYEAPKNFKAPLTGVAIEMPVDERPVAVMVENSPEARPQSGLTKADLVYEVLAEGDITRFVAVYQSDATAEAIGPVRSMRPYFLELGMGLDALIVHAGRSPEVTSILKKQQVDNFDEVYNGGDGKYNWRDKSRKAPHNLYTRIDNIRQGAEKKKYRKTWTDPQLLFGSSGESTVAATPFQKVKIHYYNGYYVTYSTDSGKGTFLRSMAGNAHVDRESEEQIAANNVIICFAKHEVLDKVGRRSVDVNGPGSGFLLQNGKYIGITWEKKNGAIRAMVAGEELPFVPGNTWIQFVPEGAKIEWQ